MPCQEVTIDDIETEAPDRGVPADIAVLIVDDQPPFHAIARTVVGLARGFQVAGEAETGEAAVEVARAIRPAMILMDINLPGISGIEATRRITTELPGTLVVLLSTYDKESLPDDTLSCGAARYVHKEDVSPALLAEIWTEESGAGGGTGATPT